MEITKIPTENANFEQWRLLSQFAYPANVKTYLKNSSLPTDTIEEYVAGCIRQGEAYFSTYKNTTLDISPLILYYGATNLLVGISTMKLGKRLGIENHGMKLQFPHNGQGKFNIEEISSSSYFSNYKLSDIKIQPLNKSSGGLFWFCKSFSEDIELIEKGGEWTLEEILGSIPDLRSDFISSYPNKKSFCIPVEVVKKGIKYREEKNKTRSILFERIQKSDVEMYENFPELLESIKGFQDSYLKPQYMDNPYYKDRMNHIILYRKIWSDELGFYSIYGQKYFELPHRKKEFSLSSTQIIFMIMGLYILGYLSRYNPEIWNYFVKNDATGERLIIENFLSLTHRYLPNLIINQIFNKRFEFIHISGSDNNIKELMQD